MTTDTSKKCNSCGETKVLIEFSVSRSDCKDCARRKGRAHNLSSSFGLTLDEYNELFKYQGGVCYLCKKPPNGRRLSVDHDHQTGEIRGLLCTYCNRNIVGNLTLDQILGVADYVTYPPARVVFGGRRYVPEGKERPKRRRKRRVTKRLNPKPLRSRVSS